MAESFTELYPGSGGSKMDERTVPNAAAGGTAHRAVMIPGADDGSVQTFVAEGGVVKAQVKDLDANVALTAIQALLAGGLVKREVEILSSLIYRGWAPRGTATSAPGWTIERISLNSEGNPTETVVAGPSAVWDDRATEMYT